MINPRIDKIAKHERFKAVLAYRKMGHSVIPVGDDKKPLIAWKKCQERRATKRELRRWWTTWPDANIGIVCGRISGITVIDCDSDEAVAFVESTFLDSSKYRVARTPRGGRHYYFLYEPELKTATKKLPGIDIRNDGSYVLAPPSVTQLGRYEWVHP
jgi:hypothetical protein